MTDNDATTTGARLALGHGESGIVAVLRQELTALERTIASSGTMLKTMTHLGKQLHILNVKTAPVSAKYQLAHPPGVAEESWGPQSPDQFHMATISGANFRNVSEPQMPLVRAGPQQTSTIWPADQGSPEVGPISRRVTAITQYPEEYSITLANPSQSGTPMPSAIPAPAAEADGGPRRSIAPSIAPSPIVGIPSSGAGIPSSGSEVIAQPVSPAAMTATVEAWSSEEGEALPQIGMNVGGGLSRASPRATQASPIRSFGQSQSVAAGTFKLPFVTAGPVAKSEEPPAVAAMLQSPQAEPEPRQGTIILDGAQLGRWVIDHLERYAARPGAMTTGIDPRMSATYPGAPTGS